MRSNSLFGKFNKQFEELKNVVSEEYKNSMMSAVDQSLPNMYEYSITKANQLQIDTLHAF
eukprot:CAMPEP_0116895114 /NCGR_PEP_ID=MMETSP0467-20121206/4729_1 /TAXON_ID=283647 /ORGANISM="Mesodinium pulex, Strain SPMC105" /LENGTH=59 /DNA_ID=CAMNT_0004565703 /DNA_START=283 /DNA_END=462 /DNA_ORIENTATION=+